MRIWSNKDSLAALALGSFMAVMAIAYAVIVVLNGKAGDDISIPQLSRENLMALDGVVPLSRLLGDSGFRTVCLMGPYDGLTFVQPDHQPLPPGFHDNVMQFSAEEDEFKILAEMDGNVMWNDYLRGDLDVLSGMAGTVPSEIAEARENLVRCVPVEDGAFFAHRHADGVAIGLLGP